MARAAWLARGLPALLVVVLLSCGGGPQERAADHRARAEGFLSQGKPREASIEFQAALQAWPQDADAAYGMARTFDALGEVARYRDALERALRLRPDHPAACVELGGVRWAEARYAEALDLARRALAASPGDRAAGRLEAKALGALGRAEEARAAWDRVLASAPDEEAVAEAASFEASGGDAAGAEETLRRGLLAFPSSWRLLLALADVRSLQGYVGGADESMARAREAGGDVVEVAVAEARLRIRRGDVGGAKARLAEAEARTRADADRSARLAVERAGLLLRLGDLEEAQAVLESARERLPSDGRLAASLAYVHLVAGRTDAARPLLTAAKGADPAGRQVVLLEAWLHLLDGRSRWALQSLEVLVAKGDLSVETHFLYARALADDGRLARARAELEAILARSPEHLFARLDLADLLRRQRDPEAALRELDKVRAPWSQMPQVRYTGARALLEAGRLDQAAALARSFLSQEPGNAGFQVLLGDVERARGRNDKAAALYAEAAEKAPTAVEPLFARVALLEDQGRARDARRLLEEFLVKRGERPDVLNRLAAVHLAEGLPGAALQRVDRSLLLEPNFWGTRLLRARVLLVQGDEGKARLELEEAIKLHPLQPEAYNQLALLQRRKGEDVRAEETYRRLLDRVPDEPLTNNNMASLYLDQGKIPEALALARVAYAGAPRSPVVLDTLGWALQRFGEAKAADPYLGEAAARLPSNPEVLLHRGLNLVDLGEKERGQRLLQKVVSLAPDSPAGREAARVLGERLPGE